MSIYKRKFSFILIFILLIQYIIMSLPVRVEASTKQMTHTITQNSATKNKQTGPSTYYYDDGLFYGNLSLINTTYETIRSSDYIGSGVTGNYDNVSRSSPGNILSSKDIESRGYSNVEITNTEWTGPIELVSESIGSNGDIVKIYRRSARLYFNYDAFRYTSHYLGTVQRRNETPTLSLSSPSNNSQHGTYSNIYISGSVRDKDVGDIVTIKYTLDGVYNNRTLTSVSSNGYDQYFSGYVPLNGVNPGYYVLRVWATDDKGASTPVTTRTLNLVNPPDLSIASPSKNDKFQDEGTITIEGFVKDIDIGEWIDIKYSIGNSSNYRNKTLTSVKANGSNQHFKADVNLKQDIPTGNYNLDIWAVDPKGATSSTTRLPITIYNTLENIDKDINKYIPLENDLDLRFVIANTKDELSDTTKNDGHIKNITDKLKVRNSEMFFIGTDGKTKDYIENNLTENYGLYFHDNTNRIVDYIINENNKLLAKSTNVFLVEDYINYKMIFEDMEKDYLGISTEDKLKSNKELEDEKKIAKELQAKYSHDPSIFDNPEKKHSKGSNTWQYISDIEDEFILKQALKEMRGKWTLYLKGMDSTKNENYDKYSDDKEVNFIIHERPKAVLEQYREENNSNVYPTGKKSYDIDYQISKPNNGIVEYTWKYQTEDGAWHKFSSNEDNIVLPKIIGGKLVTNYSLTVKDFHGATDTVVATVTPPKLMDPEPELEINTDNGDNSIFTGPYGSQQLSVTENSEPKSRITKYQYIFSFTSTADFLDTTKNLVYNSQTCTFFKNTLKLNAAKNGKVPFERDITLRITNDENKTSDDTKQVKFIPIVIDNVDMKTLSPNSIELDLNITNANPDKHNVVATLKGRNYTMTSSGGTTWKQQFTINNGDKIDVRVHDKKDNSIIYDYKQVTAITNRPPTVDANIDKTTIYEGDDVKLKVFPKDPDGDLLNVVVEHIVSGKSKVILNKGNVVPGSIEELTLSNVDPGSHKIVIIVTDRFGETARKEITFTAKQISVTGTINPNPAMAGDEVIFNLKTEGYVEKIEIVFPKDITDKDNIAGKFNRTGKYKYPIVFNVDKSKNQKTDTFKYVTSTQLDKTLSFDDKRLRSPYKITVRIHKKNRTREVNLNLDIRRSVLDLVKPGVKQKGK